MVTAPTSSLTRAPATPAKALTAAFPSDFAGDLATESVWLQLRERALKPLHVSELATTEQSREEFLEGARLLRFHGDTALPGRSPQPQQLVIADALAMGHGRNAFGIPRRSSKSTTAIAVALGRASMREDYRVGILTLTSGKAGRSRFLKDVAAPIERLYPDKKTRPLKVVRIAGMEGVHFPNGGMVQWLSTVEDVRGEAFDMLILDEAGEPTDPDRVADVMAAALPTMDTRPGAQLVVMGTAGKWRDGNLLWDALEVGRTGIGGIVEYAMPDTTTDEELADWEPTEEHPEARVKDLILASHPGVGTLTTLEAVKGNFDSMTRETFSREYGGIFGVVGATSGIVNPVKWTNAGSGAALPSPPERFGLAFAPHPDQLCGSIVAAWRDEDGRAVILQLEHKTGINWLPQRALYFSRKYQQEIVFDGGQQVALLVSEQLQRAKPRPRLAPQTFMDVKKAAALLIDQVDRDNLVHFRQPELDNAAGLAVKRKAGVNGWALGRGDAGDDITGLEAGSLALLVYDNQKPLQPRRKPVVRT